MDFFAVKAAFFICSGNGAEFQRLMPAPLFLRALSLERKRAERSRTPFVLMLIDRRTACQIDGDHLLQKAVPAILASIRETDIAGWHEEGSALGVIFTELGVTAEKSVVNVLRAKMTAPLQAILTTEELAQLRITFHRFPEDWNGDAGLTIEKLYPDLVHRDAARKSPHAIKRVIDILGSSVTLFLLSPILLAIALAIKLSSPGPILFRQKRIGQYGIPFTCLKFRSMFVGNDPRIHMDYVKQFIAGSKNQGVSQTQSRVYKITRDPRLTRVGAFLRRTSLDELPQFLNVLRGDMSMVGPRPPVPYELEAYDIWHRRRLLEVKPGITGLWQVNGRSKLAFDDMVRLDLQYAAAWSLWLDLKILLRTPRAVFSGDGAY